MNVLVIGSGGREHALAWKIAQSPRLNSLWIAPGNPGTANLGENIPIKADDAAGLTNFCLQENIDLAVIGPEASLAAGVSDSLSEAGIAVFGPSQSAARIETSKIFAKDFMTRHEIRTARYAVFCDLQGALRHLDAVDYPVVIKASGLAAGKGVIVPKTRQEAQSALCDMLVNHAFGQAGDEVIIEERLWGEEVSILAFCDGQNLAVMPPSQDHKPLLDGGRGPNTGGMGAYAPAPICPVSLQDEILETIMKPALEGLQKEGYPFVGVLYGGVILTDKGPYVLEYNARFGDPETQVILPLLETDLLDVLEACTRQKLDDINLDWKPDAAVCVVMASAGYPVTSTPPAAISGLDALPADWLVFQAGTSQDNDRVVASGGRVLGVTVMGEGLRQAAKNAYLGVSTIHFEGAQYRSDIAYSALDESQSAYRSTGVDIDAGNRAVDLMTKSVKSTYTDQVLAGIGSFGGLFDTCVLRSMRHPVLVASIDGVGTKVKLGARLGRNRDLGKDIINHCINDILVQGARPLFFLDYFATSRLKPEILAEIIEGMAEACREAGCVLIGGETAEMPGVYHNGEFDVAGAIVGCLERDLILPRKDIHPGDQIVGLRSTGPHTNGYSLLNKIFENVDLQNKLAGSDKTLADALLAPHRSYLDVLMPLLSQPDSPVKALAHITGGGFLENIPRVLPENLGAKIRPGSWPVLPIFKEVQKLGRISRQEMHRVFNMGIGMLAVVCPQDVPAFQSDISEETWVIGEIVVDQKHEVHLV